jgi:uncharacterized protein YecE (DUF72 family)
MPIAVAFRHDSWQVDAVIDACRAQGLSWVSCDYPPLTGLPTADLAVSQGTAFLRLHGRNEQTWWHANNAAERHDYCYQTGELRGWLEQLQVAHCHDAYLIFANTTKGHALANIKTVRDLAPEYGLQVVSPPSPKNSEQERLL